MSRKVIQLSILEENPAEMPEEILQLGKDACQAIWQTAREIALLEVEKIRERYRQFENDVIQQRQTALDKAAQVLEEIALTRQQLETTTRENKSLQVDITRQLTELKSAHDRISILEEKEGQQEREIKRLIEDIGRTKEIAESSQKRLSDASRQMEADKAALKEAQEEIIAHSQIRERLEKNLRTISQESEQLWKQLKQEQTKSTVAEALVQEVREMVKKLEGEIKILKEERQELKNNAETEAKLRADLEKKMVAISTRAESQETGYKEIIAKLQQELESNKNESAALRNRLIRTEGALEREKKAMERLESKLVAASGGKVSSN